MGAGDAAAAFVWTKFESASSRCRRICESCRRTCREPTRYIRTGLSRRQGTSEESSQLAAYVDRCPAELSGASCAIGWAIGLFGGMHLHRSIIRSTDRRRLRSDRAHAARSPIGILGRRARTCKGKDLMADLIVNHMSADRRSSKIFVEMATLHVTLNFFLLTAGFFQKAQPSRIFSASIESVRVCRSQP